MFDLLWFPLGQNHALHRTNRPATSTYHQWPCFFLSWPHFINHIFCFLYSDTFTCGTLLIPKTATLGVNHFLEIVNNLPVSVIFNTNKPNQSPHSTTSFIGLFHSLPLSTCPGHLWAKYQTSRDSAYDPKPAEVTQTCQPSACLPYLAHFFPQKSKQGSGP